MLCERCKIREANIKYTEIINGVKTEHNLCAHCAREMDFGQYAGMLDGEFPLGRLLSGLLGLEDDDDEVDERSRVVCPTCRTTFEDFVENSRFGCPDCYGVFDLFINDKIKQMQGSESHRGKKPKFRPNQNVPEFSGQGSKEALEEGLKAAVPTEEEKQICVLEKRLKEALAQENYEEAAVCRDEIRRLKRPVGEEGAHNE